ncbi:MAG: FeoA family protein [Candidatus Altiarchaeota archaeon]
MRLSELGVGKKATVRELQGGDQFKSKLKTMGLREGKQITVIAKEPAHGPVVVKIGNTTLTIGRGMADKILVE